MPVKNQKMALPVFDPKTRVNKSPHIVILGAGASKASFPNGDRNEIPIPLMNDLIEKIGLTDLLKSAKIKSFDKNFEEIYDELCKLPHQTKVLDAIKEKIYRYFTQMDLPEELTIYDKLILSLREKDLIATFNWDPLLLLAYKRNYLAFEKTGYLICFPTLAFLHGNVGVGICSNDRVAGYSEALCSKCARPLEPVELLYPITNKNYDSDSFIKSEWANLRNYLQGAYFITIFGYSAPKADVAAKEIMRTIWDKNRTKTLAEIEIIDVKPNEELYKSWKEFIVRSHYMIHSEFDESHLAKFPRRTCEVLANRTLQLIPSEENAIPKDLTLEEFHKWLIPLLDEEREYSKTGKGFRLLPYDKMIKQ